MFSSVLDKIPSLFVTVKSSDTNNMKKNRNTKMIAIPEFRVNLLPDYIISEKIDGSCRLLHQGMVWKRRDIKTVNLLPNIIAANMAKKKNAYEAILIQNGKVTEGTSSNIWIIKRNNLITHPANSDILKGVTRTSLLKIIKKTKLKLIEKQFTHKQLFNADEVFLTSSGSFITPILKIDNEKINNGKIGNITLKLAEMYNEACING